MIRPPVPYFGGKMTIGPRIATLLPRHRHYVEPYAGSLAVLLAKPRSGHETVNDLDGDLMAFWRVLRERPQELARACALTPHSRAELTAAHEPATDQLEVARRVWVELSQGRAGTRRRTGWRHYVKTAANPTTSMPDHLDAYIDRMYDAAERLAGVSLESMPALDLVAKYGADPDVLLYVDPPYLGSTRCRSWDGYHHEMRGDAEHRELASVLRACQSAVVLSGYPSALYEELYVGWDRHTIASGTGQGAGTWANRTEVLWSNRPLQLEPALFTLGGS